MKKTIIASRWCVVSTLFLALYYLGWTQEPDRLARSVAQAREERTKGLAEPFKGITTDGRITPGLFKIRSTGVSTKPVRIAAEAFLNGLSEEQRRKTIFPLDDPEWRMWDNRPLLPPQGIAFSEMTERQRDQAFALLRASLSAKGLQKTTDIMKLNETFAEVKNNFDTFGQWRYWITVMGKPADTEPWGWQLEGTHLVINYFVLGDQVVMTPTFMGAEPVRAESGKFKGTVAMQDEQNKGLKLFTALTKEQQAKAVILMNRVPGDSREGSNNLAQAYKDNLVLDYAGIRATDLTDDERKVLLDLIAEYVGNMNEGHARVRMDEVRSHLDRTYFGWIGSTAPEGVFYYRIQSPVILIEFDHQVDHLSSALPGSRKPTRNHIHTVVRTPNGNDYGKDLLRQHYETHSHDGGQDQPNRK